MCILLDIDDKDCSIVRGFLSNLLLCIAYDHMTFMLWQWSPQVVTANKDIFFAKWRTF